MLPCFSSSSRPFVSTVDCESWVVAEWEQKGVGRLQACSFTELVAKRPLRFIHFPAIPAPLCLDRESWVLVKWKRKGVERLQFAASQTCLQKGHCVSGFSSSSRQFVSTVDCASWLVAEWERKGVGTERRQQLCSLTQAATVHGPAACELTCALEETGP